MEPRTSCRQTAASRLIEWSIRVPAEANLQAQGFEMLLLSRAAGTGTKLLVDQTTWPGKATWAFLLGHFARLSIPQGSWCSVCRILIVHNCPLAPRQTPSYDLFDTWICTQPNILNSDAGGNIFRWDCSSTTRCSSFVTPVGHWTLMSLRMDSQWFWGGFHVSWIFRT